MEERPKYNAKLVSILNQATSKKLKPKRSAMKVTERFFMLPYLRHTRNDSFI